MQTVLFAQKQLSYLALGDSYTIGESVPVYENFPYQTVQLLRSKGLKVLAPEIVAKTGWTTDELMAGIEKTKLLQEYDFVSLLIGVNNQYRGRSLEEYGQQFKILLSKAIYFAGGKKEHVFVISIPDWGATPFAEGRDRKKIAEEIDAFNRLKKKITLESNIQFIEITEGSRDAVTDASLVAKDKLHPSGKEYAKWARKLAEAILASKGS
ncbi:MAG: SGNH/GDSL hydrolase family protein [Chitinophagia bacterium]